MATVKTFLGNIKGPKGDAYTLTDEDRANIADQVREAITPETWQFVDDDGTVTEKMVYAGSIGSEPWVFTLEDGTVIEKEVCVV